MTVTCSNIIIFDSVVTLQPGNCKTMLPRTLRLNKTFMEIIVAGFSYRLLI